LLALDAAEPKPAGFKPSYWRYLQACTLLIDAGKPCTNSNIAKELHVTLQGVWHYKKRHPGVEAWVSEKMTAQSAHLVGPLLRRHALLGQQGSVASAELILKHASGYFARGPGAVAEELLGGGMVVNLLVPRPEYPQGALPALSAATKPLVPRPDIPTLNLGQP
jgi:hypothetical protein